MSTSNLQIIPDGLVIGIPQTKRHSINVSPPQYISKPVVPAEQPNDPKLMKFLPLDEIQIGNDELKRLNLVEKKKEFLKTDLTWKQVLFYQGNLIPSTHRDLAEVAKNMGYDYICIDGKVYQILIITSVVGHPDTGHTYTDISYDIAETGLAEDDINEIL